MKRILAALAGIVGFAWWRSRKQPQTAASDPAEELRAKLAQAREADDREEFESGEQSVDEVPDVDTRRRDVHERARAQIDEMSPGAD